MMPKTQPLSIRELLRADLQASGIGPRSPLFYIAAAMGLNRFSPVLLFRLASAAHGKGVAGRFLAALLTRFNTLFNASELSPLARIGPGLHIPHTTGICFGPIRAGSNFTLLHNSSLGLSDRTVDHCDPANFPTIGDNVAIGPGAVILGPVHIGDGATVSANAVVLQDTPAGSLAVGNPAKILRRQPDFIKHDPMESGLTRQTRNAG